jgi:hypothetical protein
VPHVDQASREILCRILQINVFAKMDIMPQIMGFVNSIFQAVQILALKINL